MKNINLYHLLLFHCTCIHPHLHIEYHLSIYTSRTVQNHLPKSGFKTNLSLPPLTAGCAFFRKLLAAVVIIDALFLKLSNVAFFNLLWVAAPLLALCRTSSSNEISTIASSISVLDDADCATALCHHKLGHQHQRSDGSCYHYYSNWHRYDGHQLRYDSHRHCYNCHHVCSYSHLDRWQFFTVW